MLHQKHAINNKVVYVQWHKFSTPYTFLCTLLIHLALCLNFSSLDYAFIFLLFYGFGWNTVHMSVFAVDVFVSGAVSYSPSLFFESFCQKT